MKKLFIIITSVIAYSATIFAQVENNTKLLQVSDGYDIASFKKDKGVIFTCMSVDDYKKVITPINGTWVYTPSSDCFYYYKADTGWMEFCGKQSADIILNCDSVEVSVNGIFTQSRLLDNSNTITVHCYVEKTGAYEISTAGTRNGNENGYKFYASGVVTQAGWQDITLYGSGKPERHGTDNIKFITMQGIDVSCNNFPKIKVKK